MDEICLNLPCFLLMFKWIKSSLRISELLWLIVFAMAGCESRARGGDQANAHDTY